MISQLFQQASFARKVLNKLVHKCANFQITLKTILLSLIIPRPSYRPVFDFLQKLLHRQVIQNRTVGRLGNEATFSYQMAHLWVKTFTLRFLKCFVVLFLKFQEVPPSQMKVSSDHYKGPYATSK